MDDVLESLQAVKVEADKAARQRAKAEADIDILKVRLRETLARLKTEFHIESPDKAAELLAEREAELEQQLSALKEKLAA